MTSSRLLLWFLALAPVVCACSTRDLWAPDEPRYGQVAREMLASGDLLVPHVNGAPYAEKPPLYWWGVVLLAAPSGEVTPIHARLGGALYACACILLLALLVRRWFGDPEMGVTAAALFAATLLISWNGSRAGLDLPLTFWILLAVERGSAFLESGRILPALGCGTAWAAAILVKGPLGFLFPPAALLAMAWAGGRLPRRRTAGWCCMLLALVGVGLAWLLPAIAAGGDAYADRLLGQIRGRATGAEGHHLRPFWYFAVRAPLQALPWTLLYLGGALACVRLRRAPPEHRRGLAACAAVGVGGLFFLSALATKREVYLVPLFPFLAAASAYALHRGLTPRLTLHGTRFSIALAAGAGLALLAAAFAAPAIEMFLDDKHDVPPEVLGWSAFAFFAPAAILFLFGAWRAFAVRGDAIGVVRRLTPWMVAGFTCLLLFLLPRLDPLKSYGPVAEAAMAAAGEGPVYNIGFGQGPNLLWSLERPATEELPDSEALRRVLAPDAPRAAVVAGAKWWDRLRTAQPESIAGIEERWRDRRGKLVVLVRTP